MNEEMFNGQPSIILDHRPFYSIVIACYNPESYLDNVLTSVLNQHLDDDIQVILADDCSTSDYSQIVAKYADRLCIKCVKTNHNFAPGNTRQRGVSVATGEWLTFVDQDDLLVDNTLGYIKQKIEQSQQPYYVVTNFVEVDNSLKTILRNFQRPLGWNHGKFYNRDNLWKEFDIHFKKDLYSHQDICICSTVNCCMNTLGREPLFIDTTSYVWVQNPASLTHLKYEKQSGQHTFFEAFFADYIESTAGVYLDRYSRGFVSTAYARKSIIEVICYSYFYMQGFIFHQPQNYIRSNFDVCRKLLARGRELFGFSNRDIYDYLAADDANAYKQVQASASIGTGPYIPSQTLTEFLDYIGKEEK